MRGRVTRVLWIGLWLVGCSKTQPAQEETPKTAVPIKAPEVDPAKRVVQIFATRGYSTFAIMGDGRVKGWGNTWILGIEVEGNKQTVPVDLPALTGASAIVAGSEHSCALFSPGQVRCRGQNRLGQLGDGTRNYSQKPVAVHGLTDVVAISAGGLHTCALQNSGQVKCWGDNNLGQLGSGIGGTKEKPRFQELSPVTAVGLSDATAISAGAYHTCALTRQGIVKCWGAFGMSHKDPSNTPVEIPGLEGITAVASGYEHVCVLTKAGTVKCWGNRNDGALGNGLDEDSRIPVDVPVLSGITALSVGQRSTCTMGAKSEVQCWGADLDYQPGGDVKRHRVPAKVKGLSSVAAISVGSDHACALTSSGTVWCWGCNTHGELGNGTTTDSLVPVEVKL